MRQAKPAPAPTELVKALRADGKRSPVSSTPNNAMGGCPPIVDAPSADKASGQLKRVGGSKNDGFNEVIFDQALRSNWTEYANAKGCNDLLAFTVLALAGVKPGDELEGMLAAQLVATHNAAMECYRRAMLGEQTFEGRRENLTQANKLVRSYATLLEALNRHRGKGQQQVRVEHVHVHQGGQAIVGAVQGGGVSRQSKDQPDAPRAVTYEPGAPMSCQDPERESVPIAGGTGKTPL